MEQKRLGDMVIPIYKGKCDKCCCEEGCNKHKPLNDTRQIV